MTTEWYSSHPERSSLSVARSLSKWCRIWARKVALEDFTSCAGHPHCGLTPALLATISENLCWCSDEDLKPLSITVDSSLLEQKELGANDRKWRGTFLMKRWLIIQHCSTRIYVFFSSHPQPRQQRCRQKPCCWQAMSSPFTSGSQNMIVGNKWPQKYVAVTKPRRSKQHIPQNFLSSSRWYISPELFRGMQAPGLLPGELMLQGMKMRTNR